jgi:tagaturonate epimerase
MKLSKYSFGTGDRFAHQAGAQLNAIKKAAALGIEITPVWNKSNREHEIIISTPVDTRNTVEKAIRENEWKKQYFIDADHINIANIDRFIDPCDFFTIDVADFIGKSANPYDIKQFVAKNKKYIGYFEIPGIKNPFKIDEIDLENLAAKYLTATAEAGIIYRHIANIKGEENFVTEVSMDETNTHQTPVEFLFILKLLAEEKIPLQTIAPRFTGEFHKGVDYIGNVSEFESDFESFFLIIDYAIKEFGLPDNLKISLHSGSDKFSIYPAMKRQLHKHDKGIHVKTAGTTWLEEVIGLPLASNETLEIAKQIYCGALLRIEELCLPYASVIRIDANKLPTANEVMQWSCEKFANTLRHVPGHPDYNPHFRQLIHVGYKIAVEMGDKFIASLEKYENIIGIQVTDNLFERHIKRLFL